MARGFLIGGILAAVGGLSAACWLAGRHSAETIFEPASRIVDPAPLCPWRQPETDLVRWFPGTTHSHAETRILSGVRPELERKLKRVPAAEENSLQVHRVFRGTEEMGLIMTRRVSGEYGGIEIVLGVEPGGAVRGLRLQRLREPELIAAYLASSEWLDAFRGKRVEDPWQIGVDLPAVPGPAQPSALAVVEGVRSLLILLDQARQTLVTVQQPHHGP